jgi:hypothetical protein
MTGLRKNKHFGPQQPKQCNQKPLCQNIYEISLLSTHFLKFQAVLQAQVLLSSLNSFCHSYYVATQSFTSAGTFFTMAKPLSKVAINIFSCYLKACRSFCVLKKQWAPIFSSLKNVLVMWMFWNIQNQTNAIWVSVFLLMPFCHFII